MRPAIAKNMTEILIDLILDLKLLVEIENNWNGLKANSTEIQNNKNRCFDQEI